MVRALLAGCKTQTRRIMKQQPTEYFCPNGVGWFHETRVDKKTGEAFPSEEKVFGAADEEESYPCPYLVGQKIWVRETFRDCGLDSHKKRWQYRAEEKPIDRDLYPVKWTSPIFMPRKASRIMLEITAVRVERLQEISVADCVAEGFYSDEFKKMGICDVHLITNCPKVWYKMLWESINGHGSWGLNPWVWVIEFKTYGC